jgi:hypothetical protein
MKNYDYWKKSQITDISTFCYWLHQKGVGIYAYHLLQKLNIAVNNIWKRVLYLGQVENQYHSPLHDLSCAYFSFSFS